MTTSNLFHARCEFLFGDILYCGFEMVSWLNPFLPLSTHHYVSVIFPANIDQDQAEYTCNLILVHSHRLDVNMFESYNPN